MARVRAALWAERQFRAQCSVGTLFLGVDVRKSPVDGESKACAYYPRLKPTVLMVVGEVG